MRTMWKIYFYNHRQNLKAYLKDNDYKVVWNLVYIWYDKWDFIYNKEEWELYHYIDDDVYVLTKESLDEAFKDLKSEAYNCKNILRENRIDSIENDYENCSLEEFLDGCLIESYDNEDILDDLGIEYLHMRAVSFIEQILEDLNLDWLWNSYFKELKLIRNLSEVSDIDN